MNTEEKLLGMVAIIEHLQEETKSIQKNTKEAIDIHLNSIKNEISKTAKQTIEQETRDTVKKMQDSIDASVYAANYLRRTNLICWVGIIFGSIIIFSIIYSSVSYIFKNRMIELSNITSQIEIEQEKLDMLRSKTWSIELKEWGDSRAIILPEGVNILRTGKVEDGRKAIEISRQK